MNKLTITGKKGVNIGKQPIGLFFEDINYAADGGLYAEMIENRNFNFYKTTGVNNAYSNEYDGGYGWYKVPKDSPFTAFELKTEKPLSTANPHYMHIRTRRPDSGISNKSYDGLSLKKDMTYNIMVLLDPCDYEGTVTLKIVHEGDTVVFSDQIFKNMEKGWQCIELSFKSPVTVKKAELQILLREPGEIDLGFVSMFPEDAVFGIFRKDLYDKLLAIHPGFIRFPGGCIVEGNNLDNRYMWKHSVGDIIDRKVNWNRWAVHENGRDNNYTSKFSHYNQTYGLGYFEYFLLCESLGAKALPVVNVGLACQYQSTELVETTDPKFKEFIQDALDLIEFANGDMKTKWGKVRAEMGHEAPFNLELLGIGNEQWETDRVNFFERYTLFEKAIHKKYPNIKLIGSAGPDVHTPRYEAAWKFYREKAKKNKDFTYAIDEHYYMPPEWFLDNTHFYDEYDRSVKVFSGEYAAHPRRTGSMKSGNTLLGAVSEAAFLTGVERNSDVVVMASYAPLFARIGYTQWAPDMIWFDDTESYGTPSYHVQSMYSNNMGDYTLKCDGNFEKDKVFYSASFDKKKKEIILKVANASDKKRKLETEFNGIKVKKNGKTVAEVLTGEDPMSFNSIEEKEKIAPVTKELKSAEKLELPAYSFTVIRIPAE